VGFLLFLSPVLLETSLPLLGIAIFFTIFNFIAIKKNLLPGIHIDRHNLGTVYYAFSFFILVLLFWDGYKVVIIAGMIVMAVGDAAAAIIGRTITGAHVYSLVKDKKSLEGSVAMFLVSLLAIFLTLKLYGQGFVSEDISTPLILLISISTALIATAAEALGDRGNDNLTVPILTAVFLFFLLQTNISAVYQVIIAQFLGSLVVVVSFRLKFLTKSGSISAFILATILFGFGGWKWTLPILCFFVFSSILSKIGKNPQENIFEKGSQRDHSQVLANGGIPALLMILETMQPYSGFYIAYLGALAAATADTWATEIGMRLGKRPRLITPLKSVAAGTSGGITWGGSMGAFLGALVLALSGFPFISDIQGTNSASFVFMITLSGFIASFYDSFLGATVQAQFRCAICTKITEKKIHCDNKNSANVKGIPWINNDMVNFFNTIAGSAVALGLYYILKSNP
jgi:uncharacterized protein (TIGR00297 family)